MGINYFESDEAMKAYTGGIETLLARNLAIAIAINTDEKDRAEKDRYLLSPKVYSALFKGMDRLISASAVSPTNPASRYMSCPPSFSSSKGSIPPVS